jgi:hypothetical protein
MFKLRPNGKAGEIEYAVGTPPLLLGVFAPPSRPRI